jgi:excisionase family DNA binding protein/PAS domain S-box-containing protein
MEKILFSTPELAHFLGVFHTTVRRWIERGKIRGIRVGRNYKIPADEVVRILSDHKLPLPESLRKYKLRLIKEDEGLSTARHHTSVLGKLLIVDEIEAPAIICRKQAIIYANQAFANLVGYRQTDLIGQDVAEVIDGTFCERLVDFAEKRWGHSDHGPPHYEARLNVDKIGKKRVKISVTSLKHLPDALLLIINGTQLGSARQLE